MTTAEAEALAAAMTALALIAHDLERAGAVLDALATGVPMAELPAAVTEVGGRVAHAYRLAADIRRELAP